MNTHVLVVQGGGAFSYCVGCYSCRINHGNSVFQLRESYYCLSCLLIRQLFCHDKSCSSSLSLEVFPRMLWASVWLALCCGECCCYLSVAAIYNIFILGLLSGMPLCHQTKKSYLPGEGLFTGSLVPPTPPKRVNLLQIGCRLVGLLCAWFTVWFLDRAVTIERAVVLQQTVMLGSDVTRLQSVFSVSVVTCNSLEKRSKTCTLYIVQPLDIGLFVWRPCTFRYVPLMCFAFRK